MDFTDSETQPPDDLSYLETNYNNIPPPLAPECNSFKWKVQVIGNMNPLSNNYIFFSWEFFLARIYVNLIYDILIQFFF